LGEGKEIPMRGWVHARRVERGERVCDSGRLETMYTILFTC
jgi:hypothetical protein